MCEEISFQLGFTYLPRDSLPVRDNIRLSPKLFSYFSPKGHRRQDNEASPSNCVGLVSLIIEFIKLSPESEPQPDNGYNALGRPVHNVFHYRIPMYIRYRCVLR